MKKDSMMETTKPPELTSDNQRVTWWGYLLTFLAIGLIWWVAWVPAALFAQNNDYSFAHVMVMGCFVGAHASTFCLVSSLLASSSRLRIRCRLFSVLVIPITLFLFFNWGPDVTFVGNLAKNSEQTIRVTIAMQFLVLSALWLADYLIRKVRHHGV